MKNVINTQIVLWLAVVLLGACSGSEDSSKDEVVGDSSTAEVAADVSAEVTVDSVAVDAGDVGQDLAPPSPVEGELSVLTYNVAGLPQGISKSDPERNIPRISPMLNSFDLVLVQEDFAYHEELGLDTSHPFVTQPLFDSPDEIPMGDGLNRFSKFSMGTLHRLQWPGCHGQFDCASDCLATKGFSFARTELAPGITIDVYNLHGEAGGCPEDIAVRLLGYTRLMEFINSYSVGRPVLVAGDFNLHWHDEEDIEPLELMLNGAGLTESCMALDCGAAHIDKILFRSSDTFTFTPLTWSVPPEFINDEGENLSDHEPVAVSFAWSAVPQTEPEAGLDHQILPTSVRVLSFNMLHGLSDEDPDAQPYDLLAKRLPLLEADLTQHQDELVALQEASLMKPDGYPDVMADLLDVLDRQHCPACHALFGPVGGSPPMYDSGDAVGQVTLSRLPQSGPAHNKQVNPFRTVSHLRVESGLGKIDLYNVHVEGADETEDGLTEAQAVLDFVDDTSRDDHIVILAGDFNALPDSGAMSFFQDAGFVDLGAASGLSCTPEENSGCTASTMPLGEQGNRTDERIDYILARTKASLIADCTPRLSQPLPVADGVLWPSDHIGLACVLAPK